MKILVDHSKCSGIGICESIAPGYYRVDDEGELHFLEAQVTDADVETVRRTVDECPTGALMITSD